MPQDLPEFVSGTAKRNAKRKLSDNIETPPKRRKPKQNDIRTRFEYTGLNLPLPHQLDDGALKSCDRSLSNHVGGESGQNSADMANSLSSSMSSGHSGEGGKDLLNGNDNTIVVPSWRTHFIKANADTDLNDTIYEVCLGC